MRLKWIALCSLLGIIVILDPTQTPGQFKRGDFGGKGGGDFGGFGKGGKGGKGNRGDFGGGQFGGSQFGGSKNFGGGRAFGGGNFASPVPASAAPVENTATVYGSGIPSNDPSATAPRGAGFPQNGSFGRGNFGGGQFGGGQYGGGQYGGGQFGGQYGSGGFGGGNFGGGDRGGIGGGGRGPGGGFDSSAMWDRISRGKDSIDLNDPQNSRTRGFMEKMGTPIPSNGILTKDIYLAEAAKRMSGLPGGSTGGAMAITLSGNDGRMSLSMGGGGNERDRGLERLREQDKDGDGRVSAAEADDKLKPNFTRIDSNGDGFITLEEYRGYYAAQNAGKDGGRDRNFDMASWSGGGEGGAWGNRQDPRREAQEEKPVAIRYGHLPKGLPDWFEEYDSTKDGQVALHEWLKAGESVDSFATYDLNGDGLITADELVRYNRIQADAQRVSAIMDGTGGSTRPSFAGGGPRGSGGPRGGGRRGSDDPTAGGISLPGSTQDSASSPTERPGKGKKNDSEKERKADSDKPTKADKNSDEAGSNGRWGNAGKKGKG